MGGWRCGGVSQLRRGLERREWGDRSNGRGTGVHVVRFAPAKHAEEEVRTAFLSTVRAVSKERQCLQRQHSHSCSCMAPTLLQGWQTVGAEVLRCL